MRRAELQIALVAAALLGVASPAAAQTSDVHELRWYVHVDMVTGSEPLSFWQGFIDQATADSEVLLKGNQGSDSFVDVACCTELTVQSVGTFGSAGDGLDTPTSSQFAAMRSAIGGGDPGGSVAFMVREIDLCGGSGSAIGCAQTPSCDTDANDDPDLAMMISVEAMQDDDDDFIPEGVGGMGQTLGHERGHNACLGHLSGSSCQLMAPGGDGGCISSVECTDFEEARTTVTQGDACECHAGSGAYESDGSVCIEGVTTGLCSGGFCTGELGFGGAVELFAAGAPEAIEISAPLDEVTDDLLRTSDVAGGWTDGGNYAASIQGLAYDPDRNVVWGVLDNGANDQIVQIDAVTGAVTSTLVTLTGHPNVIALAFHPGATAAGTDDHLLANSAEPEVDCDFDSGFCSGDLIEIDPDSGAFATVGDMNFSFVAGMRGMAYDSGNGILYGTAWANGGLWEFTNLSCNSTSCSCPSSFCTLAEQTAVDLSRLVSGLAYSAESDRLYVTGSQNGPQQFHNSIDPSSFATTTRIGVQGYTTGGLAAVPLPEPSGAARGLAAATLALLARRRHRGRPR